MINEQFINRVIKILSLMTSLMNIIVKNSYINAVYIKNAEIIQKSNNEYNIKIFTGSI